MIPEEISQIPDAYRRTLFFDAARANGFHLSGIAPASPLADFPFYEQWVTDDMAGPMAYLADHRAALRRDPRTLLPSARSVLCLGLLYNTPGPAEHSISRYAWGAADYHDTLRAALQTLADQLIAAWGPFEYRICVDTAPLLERSLARTAGLGWIGRNTCLINQPYGSWFFLGEILVSLDLPPDTPPPDRCGTCRACIDACPTEALVPTADGRYRLDSRLCISTWTIEQKGALAEEYRHQSGTHLFGCDVCQDVCPWNRRAPLTTEPGFQPIHANPSLAGLATLTPDDFRARFRHTPLWRTKHAGLLRNVATAMGNSADPGYLPDLQQLAAHPDPAVRDHAAWAIRRLEALPR